MPRCSQPGISLHPNCLLRSQEFHITSIQSVQQPEEPMALDHQSYTQKLSTLLSRLYVQNSKACVRNLGRSLLGLRYPPGRVFHLERHTRSWVPLPTHPSIPSTLNFWTVKPHPLNSTRHVLDLQYEYRRRSWPGSSSPHCHQESHHGRRGPRL